MFKSLTNYLAQIFAIDGTSMTVIGLMCSFGAASVRNALPSPLYAFLAMPFLMISSILTKAATEYLGFTGNLNSIDWSVGIITSTTLGMLIGLAAFVGTVRVFSNLSDRFI